VINENLKGAAAGVFVENREILIDRELFFG
jgi:hypothetical protein